MASGGGSTTVHTPPELRQLGNETSNLAIQESQFLGEPISLGNYGVTLATGGNVPQAIDPFLTNSPINNPALYNLGAGEYNQPTKAGDSPTNYASSIPLSYLSSSGYLAEGANGVSPQYGADVGSTPPPPTEAFSGGGGTTYATSSGVAGGGSGGGSGGGAIQGQGAGGGYTSQQIKSAYEKLFGNDIASDADAKLFNDPKLDIPQNLAPYQSIQTPHGQSMTVAQLIQEAGGGQQQQAPQPGGMSSPAPTGGTQYTQTSNIAGQTVPNQNPLYGPWLNSAVSEFQNQAQLAPIYEQQIAETQGAEGQFYQNSSQLNAQGEQLNAQGENLLNMATTGTGLFPSQRAYVEAAVKSGQSGVAQQLASEGLGQSTLGPELSSEIGLQGAATAGGLIQGNISAANSVIQSANSLIQSSQAWAKLGEGAAGLSEAETSSLGNLFQSLAGQEAGIQAQLWQQGLQGYGLEAAFLNSALAPYNSSISAYNDILQGSEVQAQVNAQLTAAADAANAQIIGDSIKAVGSILGGLTSSI